MNQIQQQQQSERGEDTPAQRRGSDLTALEAVTEKLAKPDLDLNLDRELFQKRDVAREERASNTEDLLAGVSNVKKRVALATDFFIEGLEDGPKEFFESAEGSVI